MLWMREMFCGHRYDDAWIIVNPTHLVIFLWSKICVGLKYYF